MLNRLFLIALALLGITSADLRADDWPQWLGLGRRGVWNERVLGDTLSDKHVRVRWRKPIRGGYAGPAVAAGRVYVTDFSPPDDPKSKGTAGSERVLCLDEKTGEVLWTHAYPVTYTMQYNAGPRATPTVDGDRVYTLGAEGDLFCLDARTGKPLWSKRFSDSGAKTPTWGYAAHPLIDGNKLICLTGPAREGKLVTAFDKMTGEALWTALKADDIGYCPPIIVEPGPAKPGGAGNLGPRQLIIWNPESVNSLDPETGKVNWAQPFGPVKYGVSIATPRLIRGGPGIDDVLLISSSWDGAMALQLNGIEPAKASVKWQRAGKGRTTAGGLQVLMAPPATDGAFIYGVSNGGELRCLDARTGDVLWETYAATSGEEFANWSTAFIVPNPTVDHSLLFNEHGEMILARLDPKGYKELGRTKLLEPTNNDAGRPVLWCHPALANGCVFWRNDREIVCFELSDAK
jgi:outer membrane protein assembly factor BamB